jgi:hypothetical protein
VERPATPAPTIATCMFHKDGCQDDRARRNARRPCNLYSTDGYRRTCRCCVKECVYGPRGVQKPSDANDARSWKNLSTSGTASASCLQDVAPTLHFLYLPLLSPPLIVSIRRLCSSFTMGAHIAFNYQCRRGEQAVCWASSSDMLEATKLSLGLKKAEGHWLRHTSPLWA